jgi:two-component system, NtrC family, response regulator AtoC
LQAKLLTAIEDHAIRRVGANRTLSIDVRIVAATNTDLARAIADGKFREDLFHRLDLFRVRLPPLRERGDDIVELAERFMARTCQRYGLATKPIPEAGRQRFRAHRWPGNVRELAHEIERAVVFAGGDLTFANLSHAAAGTASADPSSAWLSADFVFPETGFVLEDAITRLVERALAQAEGNVSAAARLLGVSRDFVRYRLKGKSPDADAGD